MAGRPHRRAILGLGLAWVLACAVSGEAERAPDRFAYGSVVEVELNVALLKDLGLTIQPSAASKAQEFLPSTFVLQTAPGVALPLRTRHHLFQGFGSGAIALAGDLTLQWPGGGVDFTTAQLRTKASSLALELVASDGSVVFDVDHLHRIHDLSRGQLRLFNGDLRLTSSFARRIGREEHAGLAVGVLELNATVPQPLAGGEPPPCPDPDWDLDVDVALSNIDSVGPGAQEQGVQVTLLPSASLENVGEATVPWYRRFSGTFAPHDNDQHPYLVWNLYRLSGGRLEQIGRSTLKHAFHTINVGCAAPYDACSHPQYNNIFWPTCKDVYGESTNSRLRNLGPREELDARTGEWEGCGSLADRDCNGVADEILTQDPFARQMVVSEADLETPGARYFIEAWYLVRGDVDIFNSMGYREIAPENSDGLWAFPFLSDFRQGPVVDAWVSPRGHSPAVETALFAGQEGHLKVAVRTRDMGGGRVRYDYVVMNLDLNAGIDQLRLPFAPGARLLATDFSDGDDDPANDWTVVRERRALMWQAPEGSFLPWGSLIRFGLETDAAPRSAVSHLRLVGGADSIEMETLAPAPLLEVIYLP